MLGISLVGCDSAKDKEETPTPVPTEEAVIDDGSKDTGDFVEEEIPQTAPEDIAGEGMTDKTVPDLKGVEEVQVATPVVFADEDGEDLFSLTINSIESSTMAIENMGDATGKRAVLVDYSFENIAAEGVLLFDDMSFKVVVKDEVATPYFTPNLVVAEAIEKGESAAGQLAFIVDEEIKEVILVFDNEGVDAKAIFKATIE